MGPGPWVPGPWAPGQGQGQAKGHGQGQAKGPGQGQAKGPGQGQAKGPGPRGDKIHRGPRWGPICGPYGTIWAHMGPI